MIAKESVLDLMRQIDEHVCAPTENEREDLRRYREVLESEGELRSMAVVRLYELLDGLDARAHATEGSIWDEHYDD